MSRGYGDGFYRAEREVMTALIEADRPMLSSELIERTGFERSTLVHYLGEMVQRGVVLVEGTGGKRQYVAPAGAEFWYLPPRFVRGGFETTVIA